MKIAYLIFAHTNLSQLRRLIARLDHPCVDIYVHLDSKFNADFSCLSNNIGSSNVFLIQNRFDIRWGCFSLVRATLNSLYEIVNSGNYYSYISFLSGQDYPLKDNDSIFSTILSGNRDEFINCFELTTTRWPDGMIRFERHWFNEQISHESVAHFVKKIFDILLPKRKFPCGYKPYAGSQWWTLTYNCCRFILDFTDKNPLFLKFFETTRCPDEFFFQSIIMNSDFSGRVSDNNLRYIDWSQGGSHPKVLDVNDFTSIVSSGKLFARKFDSEVDIKILDLIDATIDKVRI